MIVVHGIGPLFCGVERDDDYLVTEPDRRLITRSWMVEDREPWRKSIAAFRIRVWRYGLHIGLCRRLEPDSPERPWHPKYAPVTEISKWRRLVEEDDGELVGDRTTEAGEDPAAEQVRPAEPGGLVHGNGDGGGERHRSPRSVP